DLWPLPAPRLLDLVAAEREGQLAGVLQDVPGERDGKVEVQPERVVARVALLGLQPAQQVHLLRGLPLAQQLVERLDRPGLQRGEAVQLEGGPELVEYGRLDDPLRRQPLGEAAERGDPARCLSHRLPAYQHRAVTDHAYFPVRPT